ncbi:NAD-binding protein [Halorientalis marina]|jgi:trk system potassium uptake protein TrkA|uniref:NAD-binding protein n=1 Tax=Halorientalis marina TaxID=2931976 RepID=UPI001FF30C01|nr:NAD-binding protein [Halorientalis marina]
MKLGLTGIETSGPSDEQAVLVLGGKHVGELIAQRLQADGYSVGLVDETHDSEAVPTNAGDPSDVRILAEAGAADASVVVVATPRDSRNLLIAQLVRAHFDVTDVFVLVNSPDRSDLVADVGHEPVCATTALSEAVVADLEPTVSELDTA